MVQKISSFFSVDSKRRFVFMLPQIKHSALGLYTCFKASPRFFINLFKPPVGALMEIICVHFDRHINRMCGENVL